jgi:hypothetical protein
MIQSREAWDWIINSLLSGLRSSLLGGYGSYYELCIKGTETFLFGATWQWLPAEREALSA